MNFHRNRSSLGVRTDHSLASLRAEQGFAPILARSRRSIQCETGRMQHRREGRGAPQGTGYVGFLEDCVRGATHQAAAVGRRQPVSSKGAGWKSWQRGGDRLNCRSDPWFFAVSRVLGLHHQTVQRCVERAQSKARWPRSAIARVPVGNRRLCSKPRFGWYSRFWRRGLGERGLGSTRRMSKAPDRPACAWFRLRPRQGTGEKGKGVFGSTRRMSNSARSTRVRVNPSQKWPTLGNWRNVRPAYV